MTRINIIPVEDLTDQHLMAEYREIFMIGPALQKSLQSESWNSNKIPNKFTLGKGHVMFFYDKGKYLFTVDYTNNDIADDPAQHKQSHVLYLLDAGKWTGNFVALPNNRVRVSNPALWRTGEGPPDFAPSQWLHSAEQHESYLDPNVTFNNLYADNDKKSKTKKK